MFFVCVVISDLYLFQEIVLLNPCFIFSKNLILSLIDKVTTEMQSLELFIWNVAPVVCIAATSWTGEIASVFPGILGMIDISDIIHYFDQDKSNSISQLISDK